MTDDDGKDDVEMMSARDPRVRGSSEGATAHLPPLATSISIDLNLVFLRGTQRCDTN